MGVSWLVVLVAASLQAASGQDIFVTPIPNSPFSGVVNVERSVVLDNGSIVNFKTIRQIARDGRGRIHNESRSELPASSTETPKVVRIHLYDPQSRISTMIDSEKKTYWTMTVNHPPATVPPTILAAGEGLPQNEFTKEEDLGIRDMEGVQVRGVRQTQTIPAASSGTGKEVVIADESWYSEDLRINLMVKHSDPRTGTVMVSVAQILRNEPDPALFEIPNGYSLPAEKREKKQ
jgi:hypothetical protein